MVKSSHPHTDSRNKKTVETVCSSSGRIFSPAKNSVTLPSKSSLIVGLQETLHQSPSKIKLIETGSPRKNMVQQSPSKLLELGSPKKNMCQQSPNKLEMSEIRSPRKNMFQQSPNKLLKLGSPRKQSILHQSPNKETGSPWKQKLLQQSPSREIRSPRKNMLQQSPFKETGSPRKQKMLQQFHTREVGSPRKNTLQQSPNRETGSPKKHKILQQSPRSEVGSPKKQMMLQPSPNKETVSSPNKETVSSRKKCSPTKSKSKTAEKLSSNVCVEFHPLNVCGKFDPLNEVQRILRLRICQKNKPPVICGYEKEHKQLYDLIKRTATTGESNSLLLIGPRGCGKSMLIKSVVETLYKEPSVEENLQLVQLNGLLQTDDKLALKEITRQLRLENTVGDRVFGSFAETLQFLLEAMKKGDHATKPILFILDEFDLFAQHKNQTLLYNLFDISQSAQAPVCVIGVTCRLDVVELLEKRVKSRFSHRQLYLFNKLTLSQYRDLCRSYLSLSSDFPDKEFARSWNQSIQNLLQEVSVKDILERQFSLTNDVRGLLSLLTYPVCQVSDIHPWITAGDMVTSFKIISTDTKSAMLHGVSILELSLIISMKHLTEIYEGEPFNFEMVYSEYLKFARRRSGMQVYEKPVVMKAFEHLQTLELIKGHSVGSGSQAQKEYKLMTLLVHPSQILDAVQKYPGCPTEIKQWATQSIS